MPPLALVSIEDGTEFTDNTGVPFTAWAPKWWQVWRWLAWAFWHRNHRGCRVEVITPGREATIRCLVAEHLDVEAFLRYAQTGCGGDISDERRERLLKRIHDGYEADHE